MSYGHKGRSTRRNTRDPQRRLTRRRCAALLIGGVVGVGLLRGSDAAHAAEKAVVTVNERLPFVVNANELRAASVKVTDHGIESGKARVRKPDRNNRPNTNLEVKRWYHNPVASIVKVELVAGKVREGVLQAIYEAGSNLDEAPRLVNTKGQTFMAVGWVRWTGAEFTFDFDTGQAIKTLREIDPGKVAEGENLTLLFQVPKQMTLASFTCGTYTLELSPQVPVK
ncbi:MAG: hypothetical protein GC159_06170 [Phycisphaera sp.]|nr:hypothetical protein [Phycisphaera sp.]